MHSQKTPGTTNDMMCHHDTDATEQQQPQRQGGSKKQKTEKVTSGMGELQKIPQKSSPRWPFFQSNLNPFSNSFIPPVALSHSNKNTGDCALKNYQVQHSPAYSYNPLTFWWGPQQLIPFPNQTDDTKQEIFDTSKSTSTDMETTMQHAASQNAKLSTSTDSETQTVVEVKIKQTTANTKPPTSIDKQTTIQNVAAQCKQAIIDPKIPHSTNMETESTDTKSSTDFGITIPKLLTETQISKQVTINTKMSMEPKTILQNTNVTKPSAIITKVLATLETPIVGNAIEPIGKD
jgi:hypothetical protein